VNLPRHFPAGSGEFLLFAVTPPRVTTSPKEASEIGRITLERLRPLAIDGLVLYDIDDESDRNPDERPFPFLPTIDPADYLVRDLGRLEVPAIVYRAVGKYPEDRFRSWLEEQDSSRALTVFVGSSSREKAVLTSLARAYELRDEVQPELPLGGVAIAERHARQGDEHLRLIAKQAAGCSFFITQIVYDVNAAKDLTITSAPPRASSQCRSYSASRSAVRLRPWSSSSGSASPSRAGLRTSCAMPTTPSTPPTSRRSRRPWT
jgi:hypothetical protein